MSDAPGPHPGPRPPIGPPELVHPDHVAPPRAPGGSADPAPDGGRRGEVESPAKILRIGSMVKGLLDEVRSTDLDEASRDRLRSIHERAVEELTSALSPDLGEELVRLHLGLDGDEVPSEAELRIAHAQLVGWLEGLFQGIQASLVAQQMAARQQLEGMRNELAQRAAPDRPGTYL